MYYRTYDGADNGAFATLAADGGPTGEADPATVSTFRLDKYDVTVGRFRQFVAAWNAGYRPAAGSGKHTHLNAGRGLVNVGTGGGYEAGWVATDNSNISPTNTNLAQCAPFSTWTNTPSTPPENQPINCVNWFESYAFCIWDGGFLPSEAEWEYAAAGGNEQLEYPWGSAWPTSQYAVTGCSYGDGACTSAAKSIAPVGSAPAGAGLWGQLDLAGNVFQRTLDWYGPYVDLGTNCANLSPTLSGGVIRGGDFGGSTTPALQPPYRNADSPTARDPGVGFRCARTP
jgi:sulfatase modifying factor 1